MRVPPILRLRAVRRWAYWLAALFFLFVVLVEVYHVSKPLPAGVAHEGVLYPSAEVSFLRDVTYIDDSGTRGVSQEIFDEVFAMISQARRLVLLDMFLFNDFQGPVPERTRALSQELTDVIINRMRQVDGLRVVLITDPINTVYGGMPSRYLDALRDAGVEVCETRLDSLRDSNPLYSGIWRVLISPFGNSTGGSLMSNPFGQGSVTLRSWLRMLNFKANHRKLLLVDGPPSPENPGGWTALVTSANPHDASSAHGNVAVRFTGQAVADLLETERAVLAFSGVESVGLNIEVVPQVSSTGVAVLTESAIKRSLLESLAMAGSGARVMVSVFYLSDSGIIDAMADAVARGADVRMLLDPNFDAFGRTKNGIPNRPVASILMGEGISVRWCNTHGEQCHAKMLLADYPDGSSRLLAGSANFTRRNLDDLNLETDVLVSGPSTENVFVDAREYYELVWGNAPDRTFSVPFERYENDSISKAFIYRVMEATGLSTF